MADTPPPPPPAAATPPPGWYHDGIAMRWWDGTAWGPAAPGGGNSDDRTLSVLAHGGVLVGGFILPLVLYLISDEDKRPETRWHAREALNFQLTFLAAYFAGFLLFVGGLALSGVFAATEPDNPISPGAGAGIGLGFFSFFALILGAIIANFVFSILGAVRAGSGIRWRYPIRIPFVKA